MLKNNNEKLLYEDEIQKICGSIENMISYRLGKYGRLIVDKEKKAIYTEFNNNVSLKHKVRYLIDFIKKESFNGTMNFLNYNYHEFCDGNKIEKDTFITYILEQDILLVNRMQSKILYYCKITLEKIRKYNLPQDDEINGVIIDVIPCTIAEINKIEEICKSILKYYGYKGTLIGRNGKIIYTIPTPPPPGAKEVD